jgi:hypothetical protein
MANTYIAIASTTVGSGGASSIDFQNIPSTYTDLVLKVSARTSASGYTFDYLYISFNNSSANFTLTELLGNGAAANSYTRALYGANYFGRANGANSTSNTFSNVEMYFPNYASSYNKSMSSDSVEENNGTEAFASFIAGLWSQTTAINRITLTTALANFVQYTTATLYGISKS